MYHSPRYEPQNAFFCIIIIFLRMLEVLKTSWHHFFLTDLLHNTPTIFYRTEPVHLCIPSLSLADSQPHVWMR